MGARGGLEMALRPRNAGKVGSRPGPGREKAKKRGRGEKKSGTAKPFRRSGNEPTPLNRFGGESGT